jgi:hypothetical protein
MAGNIGLTEAQNIELDKLEAKDKLTALQETKIVNLRDKRDNPVLPDGAKTYCKDWLKGQLLDYQKIFRSKYTDKGNIMEDESIDFIADQLGYGLLMKNEDSFATDFMQGTADIVLKEEIIDVKNSWDASTFPLFEDNIPDSGYYWQLQGYIYGYDKPNSKLVYTLMNTPEHLIFNDAKWHSISQGFDEIDSGIYEQFKKNLTYDLVENKYKIKVFEIERDDADIMKIIQRVKMCRDYIKELKSKL